MKLVQITDIHIGKPGENTRDVDVRDNFQRIWQAILREDPEAIIISGDLCFKEADSEIYNWICGQIQALSPDLLSRTYVLNGNHDDAKTLAASFGCEGKLHDGELYYKEEWNGWTGLFLDSGKGTMSADQYRWLEEQLVSGPDRILIFMHHPPLEAGVPFMDRVHRFREIDTIMELFTNSGKQIQLFCGHYHVDKTINQSNLTVYITPSTFFQIRQDKEDFGVDHYRIAYRTIELAGRQLSTRLEWMEGNMMG